ncbi:hydrogenase formation protein HypD [Thermosulfurimonas marina]|uniref:Hydrogenase formation protein HypD n=1 Tax=Thermosulfurimonas marina TaxID=2047767 RepID=A0A6H1WRK1_9BACT|nr:hydrogenase formation protein HypD [Thermosulfurimonas marina]QJA05847.1 hydrogenase formation protein HypD [Thermosulfurimonas marina]
MARVYRFMEVCGTHTVNFFRFGLRKLLPPEVELVSGPGCPVCVMPPEEVDFLVEVARKPGVVVCAFGDLLKVPGSKGSLREVRAQGGGVRLIYSPMEAVHLAASEPEKKIVLAGVGFETTAPAHAVALLEARKRRLRNFFFFSALRIMPPPLRALLSDPELALDGLLLPGHVSAVIGSRPYTFIAEEFGLPGVITGFEPRDMLEGLARLLELARSGRPTIEIQYRRVVTPEGNPWGKRLLKEVFRPVDGRWRGLGLIPGSKLALAPDFEEFSAEKTFSLEPKPLPEPPGCACGKILRGQKRPPECPLFGKRCTPETPYGPCMVSSEGACAAYFRFAESENP